MAGKAQAQRWSRSLLLLLALLLALLGASNVLLLLRALPGARLGGARARTTEQARTLAAPCRTASARWERRGPGECRVRTGYLASDGVHVWDVQAFSSRQVAVVSLANDAVERVSLADDEAGRSAGPDAPADARGVAYRYKEVPMSQAWQPHGERQDAEIAPLVAGLLGAPVNCVRVYDFAHEGGIRLVKLTICDLEQPLPAPLWACLASSAWRWGAGARRVDRGAGAGDPGYALTVSQISAVYSFTPLAASLVSLAQRMGIRHTYIGLCDRSKDGALAARYEVALGRLIAEGRVTLLAIDLPAVSHSRTKETSEDVDVMGLCKVPAYQMALYDAKRAGDELLLVSDLDELLVPQRADSLSVAVRAATKGKDLAKLCYVRVHADQHPTAEFSGPGDGGAAAAADAAADVDAKNADADADADVDAKNADADAAALRCDCPKARPEGEDEFAINAETCGWLTYTKSLAVVRNTWYAGPHAQYGCSETDGTIHPNLVGKTSRYDWPRPKSRSGARRPWADVDELRIAHFTNLWSLRDQSSRDQRCPKHLSTVPAEYARFLSVPLN